MFYLSRQPNQLPVIMFVSKSLVPGWAPPPPPLPSPCGPEARQEPHGADSQSEHCCCSGTAVQTALSLTFLLNRERVYCAWQPPHVGSPQQESSAAISPIMFNCGCGRQSWLGGLVVSLIWASSDQRAPHLGRLLKGDIVMERSHLHTLPSIPSFSPMGSV